MLISVKTMTGKSISLHVRPTDTTETLKTRIEEEEGIPAHLQRLIYGGRQLEDGVTLHKYGLANDSTLFLALRFLGA